MRTGKSALKPGYLMNKCLFNFCIKLSTGYQVYWNNLYMNGNALQLQLIRTVQGQVWKLPLFTQLTKEQGDKPNLTADPLINRGSECRFLLLCMFGVSFLEITSGKKPCWMPLFATCFTLNKLARQVSKLKYIFLLKMIVS